MVVHRRDQRETRRRPVLLLVIVAALVLITIDSRGNGAIDSTRRLARDALQPVQSIVDAVFNPVRNAVDGVTSFGSVKDQNARLKRRVAQLEGRLLRERAVGTEVGELEKLLDLPTIDDATGIAARVISGSPDNFERTVIVNKGASKGVQLSQPVVAGNGLVGKVTAVTSEESTVTLIDSPGFGVGIRLEGSNESGIAEGRTGDRTMRLNFLSRQLPLCTENAAADTCIRMGELVFTTAVADSAFPPDVPVAKVKNRTKQVGDLEATITLTPLVNLDDITYVKILRWPGP